MNVSESKAIFIRSINEFLQKKKDNPYFAVNYKKPLKTKQILERL